MKKILIVDDEADLRDLLADQLKVLNVEIVTAGDGQAAWEILQTQTFHAILCDITMPRMTGIELLKKLKATGNQTPFVVLTGYVDHTAEQVLALGAYDFLQKPWDNYSLMVVVRKALTQTAA